ncbi:hypothetical protein JHK85_004007 [Glycine max]|uniref:Uncharacterized protein n=2 Tax=Glycine subgen. Soja TaxID=1462606 RepID=A0A0R0KVT0_SOYBN|nr:hypothetical protein JHK87_003703 [Glycine soja]KAG5062824.1 hypothetical protein JHK85_004007 [Glycine max]KAG5079770.1 hypothetical protein JHK86_003835 [Glycine max]RZC24503.1 hypothetical protein D0Y65_003640 [Glycine soja]
MEMVLWGSFEENMVGGVGHEDPMSFINMEPPKDKDISIYGFWSVSEMGVACLIGCIFGVKRGSQNSDQLGHI